MISRFTATIMIIIAKQPPYFLTEQEQSPLQYSIQNQDHENGSGVVMSLDFR